MTLAPQLAFKGDCREAFEFYAALVPGEITVMNTFGGRADAALPSGSVPGAADDVRFAEVRFAGGSVRGNDVGEDQFAPMRGFSLSLHVGDAVEARRIFDGLADGGTVTTAPEEVDWADLFGMVTDRFGVPWLILAPKG